MIENREDIIKQISFVIGLCGSVKPESMAKAAVDWLDENYTLTPRGNK